MASIERRRSRDGRLAYRAKVRIKGHPERSATFPRLGDARRWARDTATALREGRNMPEAETGGRTLAALLDRYEARVLPGKKPSTRATQQGHLAWWRRELGGCALADVSPALLARECDNLVDKGRAPATANRYMAALSHCMAYAKKDLQWIESNPCLDVRKGKESRGRMRFLSTDERARLLDTCKQSSCKLLYPAVVVALCTGMRKGEQFTLTWQQVDLEHARIILEDTKNGERRAVALVGPALDVVRNLARGRADDDALVFESVGGRHVNVRYVFGNALKEAGIADFRWHDLRHCFASELAMSGATLAEIAEAMGHKTLAMVKRYAHLTEGHISKVVERMTARVFGG